MKTFIIIPAYNEQDSLKRVIQEIKETSKNYKVLVVDDGSQDNTSQVAKKEGVHYVIRNKKNLGLAQSFKIGLEESLKLGADILVKMGRQTLF